jgi:hypothetical protein
MPPWCGFGQKARPRAAETSEVNQTDLASVSTVMADRILTK